MTKLLLILGILFVSESAVARTAYPAGDSEYTLLWEADELALGRVSHIDLLVVRFPSTDDGEGIMSGGIELEMRRRGTQEVSPLLHQVTHLGEDRYRITGVFLHVPGIWDLSLRYQIGTDQLEILQSLDVPPMPGVTAALARQPSGAAP